jgi:hypothetical protein
MKQGPPQTPPTTAPEKIDTKETKRSSNLYLRTLRRGIENRDIETLTMIIDAIQRQVHRSKSATSPMSNDALRKLIDTGEGEIYVGTGTLGERIYIRNGELFMPQQSDQAYSQRLYNNFRYVFELADNQELRVKF